MSHGLKINPLVDGPPGASLDPSAFSTNGSGSALQKIPKRTTRTVRVEVNSMDRDYSKYPYSSEFVWQFPFPVKEIREVRVIGGTVPVPFLNVDSKWNSFTFMENQGTLTVTIPVGYYTNSTFCSTLQTQLNSLGLHNIYTVSQNPSTGALKISTTDPYTFGIMFNSGSYIDSLDLKSKNIQELRCPSRLMGFGWADYISSNGVIEAPRSMNLWYALEKSYLYMNFDSSQDLRGVIRGGGRKEPSAILYNDELNAYNYDAVYPITKYLNKETFDTILTPAPAPISRIANLYVSLRDVFYNLLNTQGRELSLLLELVIVD